MILPPLHKLAKIMGPDIPLIPCLKQKRLHYLTGVIRGKYFHCLGNCNKGISKKLWVGDYIQAFRSPWHRGWYFDIWVSHTGAALKLIVPEVHLYRGNWRVIMGSKMILGYLNKANDTLYLLFTSKKHCLAERDSVTGSLVVRNKICKEMSQ